jgi:hypothetical protein
MWLSNAFLRLLLGVKQVLKPGEMSAPSVLPRRWCRTRVLKKKGFRREMLAPVCAGYPECKSGPNELCVSGLWHVGPVVI